MRKVFYILLGLLALASCSSEEPANLEPVIRTLEAADVTRTSATLRGGVSLSGTTQLPDLFFRYGDTEAMSTVVPAVSAGDGSVTAVITGLTPLTTYYYQLAATHHKSELRGDRLSFVTRPNEMATVGVPAVLSQGPVSAIVGFDIPNDGGDPVIEAGCIVTENGQPESVHKVQAELTTAEPYAWHVLITGLKQNTSYTVVPFATTRMGQAEGPTLALRTGSAVVVTAGGDFARMFRDTQTSFRQLSIAGPMNGDDLSRLRQMDVADIDMADVTIVSGGGSYDGKYYAEDNVVGQQLFADCQHLERISLPQSATRVSRDAFKNCAKLQELILPAQLLTLEPSSGCTSLSALSVPEANTHFRSVDGVLTNADVTAIVWFPMGKTGNYTLPATITAIGDRAFAECSITAFTLPDALTTMGQAVFFGSKIEEVTLPGQLRAIPTGTFQQCSRLKTVRLGAATELLSGYVFYGCPLQHLYVEAATPPVCSGETFATEGTGFLKTCTLHVPEGKSRYYRADAWWGQFAHIVER